MPDKNNKNINDVVISQEVHLLLKEQKEIINELTSKLEKVNTMYDQQNSTINTLKTENESLKYQVRLISSMEIPVKVFKGRFGEDIDLWIFQINNYFKLIKFPNDHKIDFSLGYLRENALHAIRLYIEKADKEKKTITWEDVCEELMRRFNAPYRFYDLIETLLSTKQRKSVSEYIGKFQRIEFKIYTMSEELKIFHFIEGLAEDIRQKLIDTEPNSLRSAYDKALLAEAVLSQNRPFCNFHKIYGHSTKNCRAKNQR